MKLNEIEKEDEFFNELQGSIEPEFLLQKIKNIMMSFSYMPASEPTVQNILTNLLKEINEQLLQCFKLSGSEILKSTSNNYQKVYIFAPEQPRVFQTSMLWDKTDVGFILMDYYSLTNDNIQQIYFTGGISITNDDKLFLVKKEGTTDHTTGKNLLIIDLSTGEILLK